MIGTPPPPGGGGGGVREAGRMFSFSSEIVPGNKGESRRSVVGARCSRSSKGTDWRGKRGQEGAVRSSGGVPGT